ncbi:chemotaxis protein CheB [Asticcacaulis solisilvae]|uniref:chemotaxis protein CheB n=1 Tax=Asticcacaulis solisilvae TaxID=1217274 RepID=UPI003FD8C51B
MSKRVSVLPQPVTVSAIAIGVSAGGLKALSAILPLLPADFSIPVFIVIHLPPGKTSIVSDLFADKCQVVVREAEDKAPIEPGVVYFAPPDYHLLVEPDGYLSLSNDEPVLFSRPSVDVLFESAADAYGPALVGIVLTGANNDGAQGLKAIMAAGGQGLIEKPEEAYASMMPKSAIDACPDARIMSLDEIAAFVCGLGQTVEARA